MMTTAMLPGTSGSLDLFHCDGGITMSTPMEELVNGITTAVRALEVGLSGHCLVVELSDGLFRLGSRKYVSQS